ncbi:orexin receptor type 2-like [Anthonomus grandis grandis]|uniref:orexin receptor type 2-like n=1 Tax=Anthonomus grandis grandis TaxID=2921223 RepID=UPI0021651F2F|nr:orexin receptor type 2-like [Anthonomus grandis grandis]XP_050305849.1 orexin receptor type 2-like [Anthonomus grandis grandis]
MGANYSESRNLTDEQLMLIEQYIVPQTWGWVSVFFHVIVFIVGLFGNILVCVAVYRNHSMRTVTNYFIVNLAVADALVILFCLPFSVVWDVTSTWWFGTAMCKFVLNIQNVSVTVSILTLTFISIDRWYAICHPIAFRSTTGKAKTAICIIWIVSFICEIPETIYLVAEPYPDFDVYFTQCKPTWGDRSDTYFMVCKMVIFYFLPLILMCIAYYKIIKILWRSDRGGSSNQDESCGTGNNPFSMNMNATTEGQLRSRRKAAKMLVAVVVMFAFCFLPVHLLSILRLTVGLSNSVANRSISMMSHWLCYANSAVNPIIYNFMSGKFRQEFKSAFFQCRQVNSTERGGFTRTSTYIYRYTTTNNRLSVKSKNETLPLANVK